MEQELRENKTLKFPTKTKIATWWIRILGIIYIICSVGVFAFSLDIFKFFPDVKTHPESSIIGTTLFILAIIGSNLSVFVTPVPYFFLDESHPLFDLYGLYLIGIGLFFILSSYLIMIKKKMAWISYIISFCLVEIITIYSYIDSYIDATGYRKEFFSWYPFIISFPFLVIPLFLLLLDCKNLFKVAK